MSDSVQVTIKTEPYLAKVPGCNLREDSVEVQPISVINKTVMEDTGALVIEEPREASLVSHRNCVSLQDTLNTL